VDRSRGLQVLTATCSAVFAIGTALQTFVIIDDALVGHAMQLAGMRAAEATAEAPGFVAVLRAVGIGYLVGNAVGVLALTGRAWVYWFVLAVNATQAAGVVAGLVPPVVLQASVDLHGPAGVLPTLVTDGGAAVLVLVLLGFGLRYHHGPWARGARRRWVVTGR
jgi:hypothetical protein